MAGRIWNWACQHANGHGYLYLCSSYCLAYGISMKHESVGALVNKTAEPFKLAHDICLIRR